MISLNEIRGTDNIWEGVRTEMETVVFIATTEMNKIVLNAKAIHP